MKPAGHSGFRGVRINADEKWQAYGPAPRGTTQTVALGTYATKDEAAQVVIDYLWRCQRRLLAAEQQYIGRLLKLGCEANPADLTDIAARFLPPPEKKDKDPLTPNARAVLELVVEEYTKTGQPVALPGFASQCARLAVMGYLTEHSSLSGRTVVRSYSPAAPVRRSVDDPHTGGLAVAR